MNRKPAKQAPKTCMKTLVKVARLLMLDNLTVEDIALKVGINTRQCRRKIDRIKIAAGISCDRALVHYLHTRGMVYTCAHEAGDWVEKHRRAA